MISMGRLIYYLLLHSHLQSKILFFVVTTYFSHHTLTLLSGYSWGDNMEDVMAFLMVECPNCHTVDTRYKKGMGGYQQRYCERCGLRGHGFWKFDWHWHNKMGQPEPKLQGDPQDVAMTVTIGKRKTHLTTAEKAIWEAHAPAEEYQALCHKVGLD